MSELDRLKELAGLSDEVLIEGPNVKIGNDLVSLDMSADIDKAKFKKMATKLMALLHKEYQLKDDRGQDLAFKVTISIK